MQNQPICVIAILISVVALISLLYIYFQNKGNKGEEYLSNLGLIRQAFPEIKAPENDVNYRKLEDTLVETMTQNFIPLNRAGIREILRDIKNGILGDINPRTPRGILLRLLLDPEMAPRLRLALKYKIASVLKGIILNFVEQANLQGVLDNEVIFEKLAQAIKANHPLPFTSSKIASLFKMLYNAPDLFVASRMLPSGSKYRTMYYILDRPVNQDAIANKFLQLLSQEEDDDE